ncbi:hypothetical protein NMG60_11008294 [Bertholletia excelsa]
MLKSIDFAKMNKRKKEEPHNMITIGEYRLPVVKPGTPMYFDFPRQVQTRRISFRLLGDVTTFMDDPTEQMILILEVKLYYYADPYELGKWASLSAV